MKALRWIRSRLAAVVGRFNQFLTSRTKALLENKVVPGKPVFDQERPCLHPRRRMIGRLYLIQNLSATTAKFGWLSFHS